MSGQSYVVSMVSTRTRRFCSWLLRSVRSRQLEIEQLVSANASHETVGIRYPLGGFDREIGPVFLPHLTDAAFIVRHCGESYPFDHGRLEENLRLV